nr:hypothetical protein [Tanacetum cinerariifolium]
MSSAIQNEDRLSNFPEELLSNILSLMPTKSAVQTCILSKRWRYSWTLIHNFDFDNMYSIYGKDGWSRFVERVFVHCKTPEVNLFQSHYAEIYIKSVSKWIDEAVRLNVRNVDVSAGYLDLPSSLFVCKTLTKLRLDCNIYSRDGLWNHPSSVNLPCLKTLELATNYPSPNTIKLIRGCQVLESLSLKVNRFDRNEDIILDIPTLKILKLTLPPNDLINRTVDLHMPNLQYLSIAGSANHVLPSSSLPTFPNLKRLDLKNCPEKTPISQILERSPELEHLNIETLKGSCRIESVPSWLEDANNHRLKNVPKGRKAIV